MVEKSCFEYSVLWVALLLNYKGTKKCYLPCPAFKLTQYKLYQTEMKSGDFPFFTQNESGTPSVPVSSASNYTKPQIVSSKTGRPFLYWIFIHKSFIQIMPKISFYIKPKLNSEFPQCRTKHILNSFPLGVLSLEHPEVTNLYPLVCLQNIYWTLMPNRHAWRDITLTHC